MFWFQPELNVREKGEKKGKEGKRRGKNGKEGNIREEGRRMEAKGKLKQWIIRN